MPLYVLAAPFVLLYEFIAALAPIIGIGIGVVSVIAAILSIVVLVVAARVLVRGERSWVRVVGRILVGVEVVATLGSVGVAVIALAAVAIYA